ncbi:MAG: tetratricopeptide repeat protein [Treponemataceae bacterium]|nr:tetratricopeptide repeat protein [Treponemataceae bacterium]
MRRRIVFFVGLMVMCAFMFAESTGIRLFQEGKTREAIPALEEEIQNGDVSDNTYNYLGIAYFKSGDYDKALDAFERGLQSPISDVKQLYFNEGNVAFVKGDYSMAEACFSLALAVSPQMYNALLNRANARLMLEKYDLSLKDYTDFIAACPDDVQNEKITALISYIEEQIAFETEEKRLLAEEYAAFEAENRRVEEEAARKEAERTEEEEKKRLSEEAMQRKILEDMANSLQTKIDDENAEMESESSYEQVNEGELNEIQETDVHLENEQNEEVELNDEKVWELELKNEESEKHDLNYEHIKENELKGEGNEQDTLPELNYEQVLEAELKDEETAENQMNDKQGKESEANYEKVIEGE